MSIPDTMGNGGGEPLVVKGVETSIGGSVATHVHADVSSVARTVSAAAAEKISCDPLGEIAHKGPSVAKGVARMHKRHHSTPHAAMSSNDIATPPDSAPDSSNGSSDGGNDGGGKKKPSSGEHKFEILHPSEELLDVVNELREGGYSVATAVELYDHSKAQAEFRRKFWDRDIQGEIYRLQQSEATKNANDPESWYGLRKYRGGRITVENAAQVLGWHNVFDMLFDENGVPKNVLEIGPGNGDLIRGIQKAKDTLGSRAEMIRYAAETQRNGQKTISVNKLQSEIRQRARNVNLNSVDPSLIAIDFIPGFCRSLQKLNIAAIPGDICGDINRLVGKHTLEKTEQSGEHSEQVELALKSIDVFIMNFVGDRVEDIEKAIANIRRLAKDAEGDKRSRFMMGGSYPFSSVSDSDSKSPNIPAVKFWDQTKDMRELWTGDYKDPEARKKAVVNAVLDLARSGLVVDRIAIQPTYEAYSPHCIIEKPGDLVTKYTLEELLEKYEGTDYEQVVRDAFAGNLAHSKELVALPQIYKNVYLFGGYVRPWEDD
jgi:SAM-dependent methyltransferase